MKKFIKNLSTIDRVLQFELDQLRQQFGQLQSQVDRLSSELTNHQTQQQVQRAWVTENTQHTSTFNAYEKWAEQTGFEMMTNLKALGQQIEELHEILVEKFQDSKKIDQALISAKSQVKLAQNKEEQKILDQLGELRFHLNKLKVQGE